MSHFSYYKRCYHMDLNINSDKIPFKYRVLVKRDAKKNNFKEIKK